jgi:polysaccharide chain length determinant protein (PEP-CTERM system associated)
MIPGKKYTPDDVLAILWRYKWLIIVPTVLIVCATILYTRTLPDRYRSETVIMIQPPRVRPDLVRTTVNAKTTDRVQTITQQVMTRSRLEAIILDLDLYSSLRRTDLMEDVVERMRRDVTIEVVRGDAFRVSYESNLPVTAMKVTERLARLFIDENLRDREMLAEGTSQFLGSQLEDARRRLVEQEKKLEAYRLRYAGELPSQLESNLTAVNSIQQQLRSLADSLARDRDRLQLLDRQLADFTNPDRPVSDPVVDTTGGTVTGGSMQEQLVAAREALSKLAVRLKPEHPDIARMKRIIHDLEAKAEQEALAAPLSPEGQRPATREELARLKQIKRLEGEAELLRGEVAEKEAEQKRLRDLAAGYQRRADLAPTRETELIELTRDYDTLEKLYTNLLSKNEESKLAVNLETRQIGEQFRVLDPARVPMRPFSPNRLQLNALGTALGLALGLGLVLLIEWRDTSLKSDDDVRVALGVPVLALVPMMRTPAEIRRAQRWRLALAGASAVVLVAAVAATAWWILVV